MRLFAVIVLAWSAVMLAGGVCALLNLQPVLPVLGRLTPRQWPPRTWAVLALAAFLFSGWLSILALLIVNHPLACLAMALTFTAVVLAISRAQRLGQKR